MRFKLPRQIINSDIARIVIREIKKQKWALIRVSKNNLEEMAELSKVIAAQGLPDYLVCKKLSNNLGHGIFLHPQADPILKDQIIAAYSGDISIVPHNDPEDGSYVFTPLEDMILTKEEQLLYDKNSRYHPRRRYSLKVDAQKNGNFTRFINHSEKPNVIAHTVYVPKNSYGLTPSPIEVIYMAKKTIYPGEQLLVSYESGEKCYWAYSKIKPFSMTPKTFQLDSRLRIQTRQERLKT